MQAQQSSQDKHKRCTMRHQYFISLTDSQTFLHPHRHSFCSANIELVSRVSFNLSQTNDGRLRKKKIENESVTPAHSDYYFHHAVIVVMRIGIGKSYKFQPFKHDLKF
jgi:hypothetical protein